MKSQLQQCFIPIVAIFKLSDTFQIGSLNQICKFVEQDLTLYDSALQNCFIQFLTSVGDFVRKNTESKSQSLALIVLQSIMFNLYAKNKQTDKLKLNNSFYHSMSMSQMSMEMSQHSFIIADDMKKITDFIKRLSANKIFLKRLKLIGQRHTHKAKNQRYLQNFLQTMEYIMNKQKLTKDDDYYQAKKTFTPIVISKNQIKDNWAIVNQIIFSNKLNKIVFMLTDAPDQVYFALTRIYFVGRRKQDRRHFRNNQYSAGDMVHNLYRYYIGSFQDKFQIFQKGKNPLYRLISTYLQCFFMPQFMKFHQIILKCSKIDSQEILQFYKNADTIITKDLINFMDQLPFQLLDYLNTLYRYIEIQFDTKKSSSACIPIKKLFIYSFLLKPDLIEQLFDHTIDTDQYQKACNYIANLFFPTSTKKFTQQSVPLMQKLIELVSNKFDNKIINFSIDQTHDQNGVYGYFLQQPIINHDYQILVNYIKKIQFTPKDMKQFIIKKQTQIDDFKNKTYSSQIVQSPIIKNIKKQLQIQSNTQEQQDSNDFLAWMTVGGTHNWTQNNQKSIIKEQPKKKIKFEGFKKSTIMQVNKLYEQFIDIQFNLK